MTISGQTGTASRGGPATLALLAASGALLGMSTNLAKVAHGMGVAALPFLTWSVGIAATLLLVRNMVADRRPDFSAAIGQYYLIAALVSFAAPNLILFAAAPHIGAGFASLTVAFPPLFTYLAALAFGMERFATVRAVGIALALGGALILAILKIDTADAPLAWVAAALCVPLLLATGNIYRSARWPSGQHADALAPGMLAGAALLLAVFGVAMGSPLSIAVQPGPIGLVIVQGVAFAAQYLLFFMVQERGGPVIASLLGSVAAAFGVPISVLALGEPWPAGIVPAVALSALGIGLVTFGRRPAP